MFTFFKSAHFARQEGQGGNLKNKQTEHIVKKITKPKWPKYEKTKLQKWNEPNLNKDDSWLCSNWPKIKSNDQNVMN